LIGWFSKKPLVPVPKDFEDAIVHEAACHAGAKYLVTRDSGSRKDCRCSIRRDSSASWDHCGRYASVIKQANNVDHPHLNLSIRYGGGVRMKAYCFKWLITGSIKH
jgi:hypothetical protein